MRFQPGPDNVSMDAIPYLSRTISRPPQKSANAVSTAFFKGKNMKIGGGAKKAGGSNVLLLLLILLLLTKATKIATPSRQLSPEATTKRVLRLTCTSIVYI